MELKDKIAMEDAFEERFSDHDSPSADSQSAAMADAIEGLISLGYSSTEAYKAIHSVENADTMTADQLLKTALKHLI